MRQLLIHLSILQVGEECATCCCKAVLPKGAVLEGMPFFSVRR
jgi:hypothetical protein